MSMNQQATCREFRQVRTKYATFRAQLAEQPSEVETAYLETLKKTQNTITRNTTP